MRTGHPLARLLVVCTVAGLTVAAAALPFVGGLGLSMEAVSAQSGHTDQGIAMARFVVFYDRPANEIKSSIPSLVPPRPETMTGVSRSNNRPLREAFANPSMSSSSVDCITSLG